MGEPIGYPYKGIYYMYTPIGNYKESKSQSTTLKIQKESLLQTIKAM